MRHCKGTNDTAAQESRQYGPRLPVETCFLRTSSCVNLVSVAASRWLATGYGTGWKACRTVGADLCVRPGAGRRGRRGNKENWRGGAVSALLPGEVTSPGNRRPQGSQLRPGAASRRLASTGTRWKPILPLSKLTADSSWLTATVSPPWPSTHPGWRGWP